MDGRDVEAPLAAAEAADTWRRGLSRRSEVVAWAVIEAMLCDEDAEGNLVPPPREPCERAVVWLSRATGTSSSGLRGGFGFLTFFMQWLPIFVIGSPSRMTSLSLADRVRYLSALETSRFGFLAMLLLAFKVPMCIAAFEEGEELRSTGFDRPTTASRRQLVWIRAPGAGSEEGSGEGAVA